jgi:hypothetical protein
MAINAIRPKRENRPKASAASDYYKALTLKLDRPRYEALKAMGLRMDRTSQQILVEALDLFLHYRR